MDNAMVGKLLALISAFPKPLQIQRLGLTQIKQLIHNLWGEPDAIYSQNRQIGITSGDSCDVLVEILSFTSMGR